MILEKITGSMQSFAEIVNRFEINRYMLGTAQKLNKVAVPAVALLALANIPGAYGGPVLYGVCVSICMAIASPILLPACILGCIGPGMAPTP